MPKFIDNNQWVELPLQSIYKLFVAQPGLFPGMEARVTPITLEDGTVITAESAVQGLLTIGVQDHLDAQAKLSGYDSIHTAAIRAGYPGPYQVEGIKFATWMDNVWVFCYAVLANVQAGTRSIPSLAELIAELPVLPA